MTDLFQSPDGLSPRLTWLRKHDLRVSEYRGAHSLNRDGMRFVCSNTAQTRYAAGATEDEAELAYCERERLKWWKWICWDSAMETLAEMNALDAERMAKANEAAIRFIQAGSPVDESALATVPPAAGWEF